MKARFPFHVKSRVQEAHEVIPRLTRTTCARGRRMTGRAFRRMPVSLQQFSEALWGGVRGGRVRSHAEKDRDSSSHGGFHLRTRWVRVEVRFNDHHGAHFILPCHYVCFTRAMFSSFNASTASIIFIKFNHACYCHLTYVIILYCSHFEYYSYRLVLCFMHVCLVFMILCQIVVVE